MRTLIFQLGTNNWQRQGEFAPGSGILHEAHHVAYNAMPDTTCDSIYPSSVQVSEEPQVSVFSIDHEIPICESVSPVSSYRFHSMSDVEFNAYIDRLTEFTTSCMDAMEQREGRAVDIAIAHHSFLNPVVLSRINRQRSADRKFRLLTFVHGTALKMFAHEKAGIDPDYPRRFLPFMLDEGVFGADSNVAACAAISGDQVTAFTDVFPDYPRGRIFQSPNGYNQTVFTPDAELYPQRDGLLAVEKLAESTVETAPRAIHNNGNDVVVFCGKFADWKRLDALLHAAQLLEQQRNITTLIIGSGPDEAVDHYHSLAYETLGLKSTFFLGARAQPEIARINAMADVGVYPSRNEPFGLVFIECMACGTPVIGVNSGGPKDFVTDAVGALVPEAEGETLRDSLIATINTALDENWKKTKGDAAADYVREKFSIEAQCQNLLNDFENISAENAG